jgi:hypothetical protein
MPGLFLHDECALQSSLAQQVKRCRRVELNAATQQQSVDADSESGIVVDVVAAVFVAAFAVRDGGDARRQHTAFAVGSASTHQRNDCSDKQ